MINWAEKQKAPEDRQATEDMDCDAIRGAKRQSEDEQEQQDNTRCTSGDHVARGRLDEAKGPQRLKASEPWVCMTSCKACKTYTR